MNFYRHVGSAGELREDGRSCSSVRADDFSSPQDVLTGILARFCQPNLDSDQVVCRGRGEDRACPGAYERAACLVRTCTTAERSRIAHAARSRTFGGPSG